MWSGLRLKKHISVGVVSAGGGKSRGCTEELGVAGMVCSGAQNEILLETQSINRLCRISQLYPRTREQDPSNGVTQNVVGVISGSEVDREIDSLSNGGIGCSIKEAELE